MAKAAEVKEPPRRAAAPLGEEEEGLALAPEVEEGRTLVTARVVRVTKVLLPGTLALAEPEEPEAEEAELPVAVTVTVPEPEAVLVEEPDLVVVAEMDWLLLVSTAVLDPVTEDEVGLGERGKDGDEA